MSPASAPSCRRSSQARTFCSVWRRCRRPRVPGQNYRITDLDLASRLSYFLWATGPDVELLKAAGAGTLHQPLTLEKQVRRMLADPRAEALSTRFASQWLRLQDVDKIKPDALLYPSFDNELAEAYKRETELFFDSIVREDRSVLDLLNADYAFVNERTAKVYRIPNIIGAEFRRVHGRWTRIAAGCSARAAS